MAPDETDDEVGHFIDTGFVVDLFADVGEGEGSVAQRVLAGEPICILPLGKFWRGGQARDITEAVITEFVENYEKRGERGIRRKRLAVAVGHDRRGRGWYKDVMPIDGQGLGATFTWNRKGRQALEDGEFAYFSPTVYWRVRDRVTNDEVRNQLGGGALTNYPFFGEATALFSLRELSGDAPPMLYAITKTDGGVEYPARAYLVAVDPQKPTTWHLRVMSWRGGKLALDHDMMGRAKAALTSPGGHRGNPYEGPQKAEATRKLKKLYTQEGLEFTLEGGTMSDKDGAGGEGANAVQEFFARLAAILPAGQSDDAGDGGSDEAEALREQMAEMSSQIEALAGLQETVTTLQTERDTFAAQVEGLTGRLSTEEGLRRAAQYSTMVLQEFAHLPGEQADLAAHLSWLHSVDTEDEQPHATFFLDLLRSAEAQFADAFSERGGGTPVNAGVLAQIDGLARQYIKDHPETEHMDAISAVLAENSKLYEAYTQDVAGGVQ